MTSNMYYICMQFWLFWLQKITCYTFICYNWDGAHFFGKFYVYIFSGRDKLMNNIEHFIILMLTFNLIVFLKYASYSKNSVPTIKNIKMQTIWSFLETVSVISIVLNCIISERNISFSYSLSKVSLSCCC